MVLKHDIKAQGNKEKKIDKLGFFKTKSSSALKDSLKKVRKTTPQMEETVCKTYTCQGLSPKYIKNLYNLRIIRTK